jgi:hypothetical protein
MTNNIEILIPWSYWIQMACNQNVMFSLENLELNKAIGTYKSPSWYNELKVE